MAWSTPEIGLRMIARSATHPAIGPTVSRLGATGTTPWQLTRPKVGLHPATPQNDAGRMIDPPVCEPIAPRHIPAATPAAEPLEVPRIARRRWIETSELSRDRFAEDDCPSLAQLADHGGIALGRWFGHPC